MTTDMEIDRIHTVRVLYNVVALQRTVTTNFISGSTCTVQRCTRTKIIHVYFRTKVSCYVRVHCTFRKYESTKVRKYPFSKVLSKVRCSPSCSCTTLYFRTFESTFVRNKVRKYNYNVVLYSTRTTTTTVV